MHEGHRDRMRNRYIKEGIDAFEPHNVLEMLLFYCIPRKDTNELAHALIKRFGSLTEVLDAPVHELERTEGLSRNAAVFLSMIPDVCRYYMKEKKSAQKVCGKQEIERYIVERFIGLSEEHVILACIDNAMRLTSCDIVCEGSVNSAAVSIRAIVDLALRHNAVAVILAHNHPRGLPLPSREDIVTTQRVHDALETLSIRLLDHIICTPTDHTSLADTTKFDYLFE